MGSKRKYDEKKQKQLTSRNIQLLITSDSVMNGGQLAEEDSDSLSVDFADVVHNVKKKVMGQTDSRVVDVFKVQEGLTNLQSALDTPGESDRSHSSALNEWQLDESNGIGTLLNLTSSEDEDKPAIVVPASLLSDFDSEREPLSEPGQGVTDTLNSTEATAERVAATWFEQLDPKTRLDDIPINKLGHICNLNNAIDIPYHWLGRVREISSLYLKKAIEATDPAIKLKCFFRYKLLPLAFLGKSTKSGRSFVPLNKLLATRYHLLKRFDWSLFLVGNYARPEYDGAGQDSLSDQERMKLKERRVSLLCQAGEVGKAARRLMQPEVREVDRLTPDEKLDKMRAFYPELDPMVESLLSADMKRELHEFRATPDTHVSIDTRRLLSLKILRNKLVKGGFAKARYEHMADMLEVNKAEQSPAARSFTLLYVKYLELLINGELPAAFYCIMADVEASGIQKPKSIARDLRPIGFNDIDRRIAYAYLTPMAVEESQERFSAAAQVASQPAAAEKYIFRIKAGLEACREHDIGDLDACTAFQLVPTDWLLYCVLKAHPWMYTWVKLTYGMQRHVYVCIDHIVHELESKMGVTQGCVGAGYLYNLATVGLLERIRAVIRDSVVALPLPGQSQQSDTAFSYTPATSDLSQGEGLNEVNIAQLREQHQQRFHVQHSQRPLTIHQGGVVAYYDNITFHAKADAFDQVMDMICQLGPRYGYKLNMSKTRILLGVRGSSEEASARKLLLMDKYGLPDENVLIHPNNCRDDAEKALYGLPVLGGFVGTDQYIQAGLRKKIVQLREEKDLLVQYSQQQSKFAILQRSYLCKFNHLLRTTSPYLIREYASQFDQLKKEVVESIASEDNRVLDATTWRQMELRIKDGGLGLNASTSVISPAYIAGVVAAFPFLPEALQNDLRSEAGTSVQFPGIVESFRREVSEFNTKLQSAITIESLFARDNYANKGCKLQEALQDQIYDKELQTFKSEVMLSMSRNRKAIFLSTCSAAASAWLTVIPRREELRIPSAQFQAALCHRYHLDQPSIPTNLRCTCKRGAMIDVKGAHIQQFCGMDGLRSDTHDSVAHTLADIMRGAGCLVRTEQRVCPDSGRRSDCATNQNPLASEPLHVDVKVTAVHPETGQLSNANALKQGRAAAAGFSEKINDYGNLPTTNNFQLLPFSIENHGFIEPRSLKLLEVLAAKAEISWRIPSKVIYGYYLKLISVSLQRGMANSIVSRARTISSGIATSKSAAWRPVIPEQVREYMHIDRR